MWQYPISTSGHCIFGGVLHLDVYALRPIMPIRLLISVFMGLTGACIYYINIYNIN